MKIIQRGNRKQTGIYILECPKCGYIAEFTNADIQGIHDGYPVVGLSSMQTIHFFQLICDKRQGLIHTLNP